MKNRNTNTIFSIGVIITAFTVIFPFGSTNLAFSQAVELLPVNTGNETLDSRLPVFYDCIEEAVDASANAPQAPYFEDEPTKNEVRMCYQEVLIGSPVEQVTDNPVGEKNWEGE